MECSAEICAATVHQIGFSMGECFLFFKLDRTAISQRAILKQTAEAHIKVYGMVPIRPENHKKLVSHLLENISLKISFCRP